MDIVGKARRLERRIARSVDAAVGEFLGDASGVSALEIIHAVVDAAEQQVQEAGRGRRLFPFNRVVVYVPAAARDKQARARFAAVAAGPPSLTSRLRERLEAAGCKADDLSADIVYVAKPQPEWRTPDYHVDFARGTPAAPPPAEAEPPPVDPPRLRLTVTVGTADRKVLLFDGGRVDIGRRAEVLDAQQRLVRTNHVAFTEEGEDVNRTVSRRHAHIIYNPAAHEYRLWDDRSAHGTAVVRGGRMIPVPSGARGTRLQTGDEIVIGQARLRVALEPASKK